MVLKDVILAAVACRLDCNDCW